MISSSRFQSTLPVGGATGGSFRSTTLCQFQSTLPVGGATFFDGSFYVPTNISIHAPRGGERRISRSMDCNPRLFQSTLPVGGATASVRLDSCHLRFQSTLPVGGATQDELPKNHHHSLSIHAPRGGSDYRFGFFSLTHCNISIHAPRGGSDDDRCQSSY